MENKYTNKYSSGGGHFTKLEAFTLKDKIDLIIIFKEIMTKFIYEIRNKLVYERCEVIL